MNIRNEYIKQYGADIIQALAVNAMAVNARSDFDDGKFFAAWQDLADNGEIVDGPQKSVLEDLMDSLVPSAPISLNLALAQIHYALYNALEKVIFDNMSKAEAETMFTVLRRTGARIKIAETHNMSYGALGVRDTWDRYHEDDKITLM